MRRKIRIKKLESIAPHLQLYTWEYTMPKCVTHTYCTCSVLQLSTLLAENIFTDYLVVTIPNRKPVHYHLRRNT